MTNKKAQIEPPVQELISFLETQESEKFQLLFADVPLAQRVG